MTIDVFISHSSKDKLVADAICAGLEAKGIRCWIAPRDILPGDEWTKSIVNAISTCKVFLLVFTENSNNSSQALKEVDLAVNHGKTLIPFRLENIQPTGSMEYYLGGLHWLDALSQPVEKHIEQLAKFVKNIVEFSNSVKEEELPGNLKPIEEPKGELTEGLLEKKISEEQKSTTSKPEPLDEEQLSKTLIEPSIQTRRNRKPAGIVNTKNLFSFKGKISPSHLKIIVSSLGGLAILVLIIGMSSRWFKPKEASTVTASVIPNTITTQVSNIDGMTMVYVSAGEFTMGSPEGVGWEREYPEHQVYLDAYWIDLTEVSNRMFSEFVRDTGYKTDAEKDGNSFIYQNGTGAYISGADWEHPKGPGSTVLGLEDHPVVNVSWNDAVAYCKWAGRELPTEAQWEKAARGSEDYTYPWGNNSPTSKLANYNSYIGDSSKLGSYPGGASPYGALDMAGNVYEWVADWYGEAYSAGYQINPTGPSNGFEHVLRGGSWYNSKNDIRTAFRSLSSSTSASNTDGFRCALTANEFTSDNTLTQMTTPATTPTSIFTPETSSTTTIQSSDTQTLYSKLEIINNSSSDIDLYVDQSNCGTLNAGQRMLINIQYGEHQVQSCSRLTEPQCKQIAIIKITTSAYILTIR